MQQDIIVSVAACICVLGMSRSGVHLSWLPRGAKLQKNGSIPPWDQQLLRQAAMTVNQGITFIISSWHASRARVPRRGYVVAAVGREAAEERDLRAAGPGAAEPGCRTC